MAKGSMQSHAGQIALARTRQLLYVSGSFMCASGTRQAHQHRLPLGRQSVTERIALTLASSTTVSSPSKQGRRHV